jgi:hypothetical protein
VWSERRAIEDLLWALKPFANLRGWIPLRYLTTFLTVALDEGKGPNTYARGTGMDRASMSRCLRDIGEGGRRGEKPGLGLVRIVQDPANVQRRNVFLTDKGRALLPLIMRSLRGGGPARVPERDSPSGVEPKHGLPHQPMAQ